MLGVNQQEAKTIPMNIIQRAERFVESLIRPADPRQCAHCGYRLTKKHGSYWRRVRLLAGAKRVRVQRYWCPRCRRPYGASDRRWARYGRGVQRKALDRYIHVGGSLRATAEWLRGELAPGSGRSRQWCPPGLTARTGWRREARSGRGRG
jgi:hypothetical protein